RHRCGRVDRGGRFTNAAFLVHNDENPGF
ncbi:MAG: hypothetical protein RL109_1296, partial [Pseudomonadota bacterium]